jgi:hypothetical protein
LVDAGPETRDPRLATRDPGPETRDPRLATRELATRKRGFGPRSCLGSWVSGLGSRVPALGSQVSGLGSRPGSLTKVLHAHKNSSWHLGV